MPGSNKYRDELQRLRSIMIAPSLQERRDIMALEIINAFSPNLDWDLEKLAIDSDVWKYVKSQGYDPKLVLCHPNILSFDSTTSLYYRGLSGLSLKAAKSYLGAIDSLEQSIKRSVLKPEKALLMAQTYNSFICSIIKNINEWTLENGFRTIIANLGITLDGKMRNKIGKIAEERIRKLIVVWLIDHSLMQEPSTITKDMLNKELFPSQYLLINDIEMKFGSEPDISFIFGESLLATVEIKGGSDPAGALERYGAATKSFQEAIRNSKKCENFYLGAVFTDELINRINEDRLVKSWFDIVKMLEDPNYRNSFFKELFHHSLRII